ncbi:ABC transporter permease [Cryobacterium sp. TMT1-21]|uniref:Xylose transport system permease protein XylH n=1 Tax=Cryobacterium shii TaxID=1259235 RepID=A0AAQ2HGI1_9MICO|nr:MULTISPECIES: ABC transporter permease [Cryobacterium]TFC50169.1 ABC transporter permease [Cryobacterium shii]TFC83159.1 ABC transporter permease [Cryobacterium sp. TmT2-59]TFD15272.1 ABC transporter permease [Cryobacterium sp. TMT4-10]TFD18120.1 ABC transporter permease [Cryobacterium sp. TMT1-21]TFD25012.1 ABC transporter permease [Cryobacterium sp. TMT2-23]
MTLTAVAATNERRKRQHPLVTLLRRPEVGAAVAALAVFTFFSVSTPTFLSPAGISTWLYSASLFGIMAVAVALLMIGGEFDLSAGAMTGTAGLIVGVLTTEWGVNIWLAMALALAVALLIGAANAFIVMKTGLPSFIVTLATFFILQGCNLAVTKLVTGTVAIQGMGSVPGFDQVRVFFGSSFAFLGMDVKISIVWWMALTLLATWVLLRTRGGNWIFAVGGQATSSRQAGVPVLKVKLGLFMTTAGAAWLVGMLQLFDVSTVQATTGIGQEFIYIICAVVGGCLLTGGYGSAIGAALGALIYGMTLQGIVFAQWDNNWLKAFLGGMLLLAVLVNLYVRKQTGVRS